MIKVSHILKTADQHDDWFRNITLKYLKEKGIEPNHDGSVTLYHGTSTKNAMAIQKSGKFKGFPFFSLDRETAERYAKTKPGRPIVMTLQVDPAALTPTGGYLSARMEGLHLNQNRIWSL